MRACTALRFTALAVGLFLGAACAESPTTPSPATSVPSRDLALIAARASHWLPCRVDNTRSYRARVGPAGGRFAFDLARIVVPPGAAPEVVTIEATLPAGNIDRIDLTVNGGHYSFRRPVTIHLGYGICGPVDTSNLSVWCVDDASSPVEFMGGTDNRPSKWVRFNTTHFSGFVIAD